MPAVGGRSFSPCSRWTRISDRRRNSARSSRGTANISLMTSIGRRPAKSLMASQSPAPTRRSRCSIVSSRIRGSRAETRRGVNVLEISERNVVCSGGSIPKKDVPTRAAGPAAEGSTETPCEFENRSVSLKPARTSRWRERAQKSSFEL